jgi:hypothetical protein
MPSSKVVLPSAVRVKGTFETTGDVRRALANTIKGVMHGDIKSNDAMTIIKGCEQMNNSLYAEIKYMAMLVTIGQQTAPLGELRMFGKAGETIDEPK